MKTVVLFFTKGEPTKKIWYYQLNPGRNLGKTNALNEADMEEFLRLQETKEESENSWTIDVESLDDAYDLSVKNPNKVEEVDNRKPVEILNSISNLNKEIDQLLVNIANNIVVKEVL